MNEKKKKIIDCECGWVKPKHWQTIAPKVNIPCEKNTTATATRRWQNKSSNEQNKSTARAFSNFVHLSSIPLQNNNVKSPKYLSLCGKKSLFTHVMLKLRCGTANDGKHIHAAICVISTENVNYLFNRRTVKRCSPGCKRFLLLVISFNLNWLIFQTYGEELHFVAFIRVLLVRLGTSSINYRQFILSCTSWRNILKEQEKISRLPLKAISKQ